MGVASAGRNGVRSRAGRLATSGVGRLGADGVVTSASWVGDSDGDGGGADAGGLLWLGGLARLGGGRVGGDLGALWVGWVLRNLGGLGRVLGVLGNLAGSRVGWDLGGLWVGGVLRSLGGGDGDLGALRVGWVLRVLGSLGGLGRDGWVGRGGGRRNGRLTVSVAGNGGSDAGESSEGGDGVTHFDC